MSVIQKETQTLPKKTIAGFPRLLKMLPRLLLFPVMLIIGYYGFINQWGGDHWLVQTAWVLFLSFCAYCVGGSFHESTHLTLFQNTWANIWYGRLAGLFIGIPYSVYRETHRRHHACLNTPKDYELWPYCDPNQGLTFLRLFAWFDIVAGVVTAPYIYGRVYFDRQSGLKPELRKTIGLEYLAQIVVWGIMIGSFVWAIRKEVIVLDQLRLVWFLPLLISPMFNTIRKFTEHLGMKSTDPIQGTRTVIGNNLITRLSSYFNFDLHIHGPHHRYPKVHATELEPRLKTLQQAAPEVSIPLFSTYAAAVLDMLPNLWKYPRVGH